MRRRHLVVSLGVAAVVGAATTVVVAWRIAVPVLRPPTNPGAEPGYISSSTGGWYFRVREEHNTTVVTGAALSARAIELQRGTVGTTVLPAWSRMHQSLPVDQIGARITERGFGWPAVAPHYAEYTDPLGTVTIDRGWGRGSRFSRDYLPLAIAPRGFALDTALFTLAAWPVVRVLPVFLLNPRWIRRTLRRRRGRCIRCGYALQGRLDAGCPECGRGRS